MDFSYSTPEFEDAYTYTGSDLGGSWTPDQTFFRVWAPTAQWVGVNLYHSGNYWEHDRIRQIPMERSVSGTWTAVAEGDLNGIYYTYEVYVEGSNREACDPYARTTGVNGLRAMVLDLNSTNPAGWETDRDPHYDTPLLDSVLYELHLRDFSMNAHSGIHNKGKFLALTETGTRNKKGILPVWTISSI